MTSKEEVVVISM